MADTTAPAGDLTSSKPWRGAFVRERRAGTSLLRGDSRTAFVQASRLSRDVAGRQGGVCRPPRGPLPTRSHDRVVADTEAALAKGYK